MFWLCIFFNQVPAPQMMNPDDFLQTQNQMSNYTDIYGKTSSLTTDYVFFFLNPWKVAETLK